jgi:hypothetical protein
MNKMGGHMTHMKESITAYMVLVKRPDGDWLEYLNVDWRIILKLIANKWFGEVWLRIETSGGFF